MQRQLPCQGQITGGYYRNRNWVSYAGRSGRLPNGEIRRPENGEIPLIGKSHVCCYAEVAAASLFGCLLLIGIDGQMFE